MTRWHRQAAVGCWKREKREKMKRENYEMMVFPGDGLGTGVAQLPSRAPITYAFLVRKVIQAKLMLSVGNAHIPTRDMTLVRSNTAVGAAASLVAMQQGMREDSITADICAEHYATAHGSSRPEPIALSQ